MTIKQMLITGGAGFIGVNAAKVFSQKGWDVTVMDNLSRNGAESNLEWLQRQNNINFIKDDIRNRDAVVDVFRRTRYQAVIHLAAQVAVTTSVINPQEDFEINACGTFNILEAARCYCPESPFIYASTNKVYGGMESVSIVERNSRYEYAKMISGIAEDFHLDFYSPYGCSKGTGDQYVLDYARIYGLPATSFRQSCIYGPHQFGIEDQGWVAWFCIAAILNKPITIYGNGKQLRDILNVNDLIRGYEIAIEQPERVAGQAFNIGGGSENTLSPIELISILEEHVGKTLPVAFDDWRLGDQKVFVCNIGKANSLLKWRPKIKVIDGLQDLIGWIKDNHNLIRKFV